jgi:threonine/homoserine/homoserine lactone efflux protein
MKTVNAGQMILASGVIALAFIATLSFYAIVANTVRESFKSGNAVLWLHRIAGFLMMGVGAGAIGF